MLYVHDDTDNDDEELQWIVSASDDPNDDDEIIARFRQEKMAELFVEYANANPGEPING